MLVPYSIRTDLWKSILSRGQWWAILVERTANSHRPAVEDVGIYHRRSDVGVAEEFLDGSEVVTCFEPLGCKRDATRCDSWPVWLAVLTAALTAFWTTVSWRWCRRNSPVSSSLYWRGAGNTQCQRQSLAALGTWCVARQGCTRSRPRSECRVRVATEHEPSAGAAALTVPATRRSHDAPTQKGPLAAVRCLQSSRSRKPRQRTNHSSASAIETDLR
jgi:hypothetical protein